MKRFQVFFISAMLLSTQYVFSQTDTTTSKGTILYEKVYIHTDRELYTPGDNIWLKSYLVSGINHKLIPGYKNIYIQLIADSGNVTIEKMLLSKDGSAIGDIQIPQEMTDGTYTLRAFTRYLQNFGDESYFHKKIVVASSKNSMEIDNTGNETEGEIDVAFLPEGGKLVLNAINHVAFKAIDKKGRGVDVGGKIVDETGAEIVQFHTSFKGMGRFMLMPQPGKSYFALLNENPGFHYQFQPAEPNGIALNCKTDGNYLQVTLSRNLLLNTTQEYLLRATHKGIELFFSQVKMTDFQHAQRLFKGLFPLGISKITVLDNQNQVVAERLVFVQNQHEKAVQLTLNKDEFKTRDKVKLDISSMLAQTDTFTSVSISVVNEDYLSSDGNIQNIESYLLFDSELKGAIESPASFFTDENNIRAEEKLDLAMMVNGWRSYYWSDLEQFRGATLPNWADFGLTIKGQVVKQWGGKPVENGKVVLGPFSSAFLFEEARTDANGMFSFDKLYLKDMARIMINAEAPNGNKRNDILLEPQFQTDSAVSPAILKTVCNDIAVPMKFYRENYYRHIAESEYLVKSGILLDEVQALGNKVTGDGHFRLYAEPDISMTVLEDDANRFSSILDYLSIKSIPGVLVTGESVSIRGAGANPLLLVDGIETSWSDTWSIPMGDIDKIEILKSGFGMSVYGSRGGNGVIAVLTKMGKGEWENNWERIIHGRLTASFKGFHQPREFYSPKYTAENLADPKPDYRPTLLWNPDVKFENGKANIEFFTADNLARYHIFVEGISKSGKICNATSLLTVSIPRR